MANKYGRQIFFTREQIHLLKRLVSNEQMEINDQLRTIGEEIRGLEQDIREAGGDPETAKSNRLKVYKNDLQEALEELRAIETVDGKLWYYVSKDETNG